MTADLLTIIFWAVFLWLSLPTLTYLTARGMFYIYGEPDGWRFNGRGANPFLGHISFYQITGNGAVVLDANILFPLVWKGRTKRYGHDLETDTVGPVWRTVQWAIYRMESETVGGDESDEKNLICMFCGQDGFDSQSELENHIDSHPYTAKRSKYSGE